MSYERNVSGEAASMSVIMPTIIESVVIPVDLGPQRILHPAVVERLWLDWAKIAWMEKGPEAGESVLAYYIALRDGGSSRIPTGKD